MPREVIQVLTPLLSHCHSAFQESSTSAALPMGPYFPRKGIKPPGFGIKTPRRPMVQMAVPNTQIEPKVSMLSIICKKTELDNKKSNSSCCRAKTKTTT